MQFWQHLRQEQRVQEGRNESKQTQDAGMQLRLQEKMASPPDSALEEADWQAAQVNLDCSPIDGMLQFKFSL